MASTRIIEEERGTYGGDFVRHPHNGYWAGDFSADRRTTAGPTRPRARTTRPAA